jgi:UDP-N-acetylglucosamine 2-epimerase (non-hydrolysing)
MRIVCVVGARPNFIKIASVFDELRARPVFKPSLVHTGQHFSPEMSEAFFAELNIPEPDMNLGVGRGTHTQQTVEIMRRLEPVFESYRPDLVLVVGDVNSTMSAALVAAKMCIPVAHVEAGLRSRDRRMPEEVNRVVTDTLSEYLFASEPSGVENLLAEGVPEERVHLVGNVMIDTLLRFRDKAAQTDILPRLQLSPGSYAVVTLHRPSNVDEPAQLQGLLQVLARLAERLPVVFPVHPRTSVKMDELGLKPAGVMVTPPLGYLDFLRLMSEARLVLTDSGGIQEETTILRVPCLTLRENTERPITISQGTNRLAGVEPAGILKAALETLASGSRGAGVPELWDGRASQRIADVLESSADARIDRRDGAHVAGVRSGE